MSLIPSSRYPAQTDTAPAYPQGKARNAGSYQDGTGTPLEKDWINDIWGFMQALIVRAGITPSGTPDEVGASDALDAVDAIATSNAQHQISATRLRMRQIGIPNPFASVTTGLGVISRAATDGGVIAAKGGSTGVHIVYDDDETDPTGSLVSVTSVVTGIARNGSRLLAIGSGGNFCCFSTNEGASWSAGSALAAAAIDIVYNVTHSRFMASFVVSEDVAQDVDGASTWTSVATGLTSAQSGIAVLSDGTTVVAGLDGSGDVDFAVSGNGGGTWSVAGGTVPNAGDYDDSGWVTGDGGATVFHAGRAIGGTELRVCSSTDGLAWTLIATVVTGVNSKPRLLRCKDTGLLVIVWESTGSPSTHKAIASVDNGVTWTEPMQYVTRLSTSSYGVALGRLFSTIDERLFATDRLAF